MKYYLVSDGDVMYDYAYTVLAKNKQQAIDIVFDIEYKESNKKHYIIPTFKKDLKTISIDKYLENIKQDLIAECINKDVI